MSFPRRGEVFWGPGKKKIRPLLVVSNDQGNRYSNDVVVIPGTTQKKDVIYPVEILVTEGFSNHTNISQSTISRYINLLETLFISFRVYQFRLSLVQGIKKMPKIYIADTGLICSLLKIKDQKIPLYLKGRLFENFVFQQLLVHTSLMEAELFFWREKQKEIDFIISYNHNIFPVEVKLSKKVNIADAKNIIEFSKKNKISNGFIIHNGNEIIEIGKNIYAIPWYLL